MRQELHGLGGNDTPLSPEERIRKLEAELAASAKVTAKTRRLVYALLGALGLGVSYAGADAVDGAALTRLDKAMDKIEESEQSGFAAIDEAAEKNIADAKAGSDAIRAAAESEYNAEMEEYTATFEDKKTDIEIELHDGLLGLAADLESQLAANESARLEAIRQATEAINAEYGSKGATIADNVSSAKDELRANNDVEYQALRNRPTALAETRDGRVSDADDVLAIYSNDVSSWYLAQKDAISGEHATAKWMNSVFEDYLSFRTGARRYEGEGTIGRMLDCDNFDDGAVFVVDCQRGAPQANEELNGPYTCTGGETLTGMGQHMVRVPGYEKFDADEFCARVDGLWAVQLEPR